MPVKQETFDAISEHLLGQNQQCINLDTGELMYRCGTLASPAGFLIGENNYQPFFEEQKISRKHDVGKILYSLGHAIQLVIACEQLHDNFPANLWESMLIGVASEFGVSYKLLAGSEVD